MTIYKEERSRGWLEAEHRQLTRSIWFSMVAVRVFSERATLTHQLGEFIVKKQDEALLKNPYFKVSVSGGSLINALHDCLVADKQLAPRVEWSKWQVYFSDERIVPLTHDDSNYGTFKKDVLDKLPSAVQVNVHHMDDSLVLNGDAQSNNKIAAEYEQILPESLDLVLLGCGPDGHTCSLFPGEKHKYLLSETTKRVAWCHDSPKPPSDRITFTLPVLKEAGALCFVAEGSSKQDIMHDIFDLKNDQLPTVLINKLYGGKTSWFVNDEAFVKVQTKTF